MAAVGEVYPTVEVLWSCDMLVLHELGIRGKEGLLCLASCLGFHFPHDGTDSKGSGLGVGRGRRPSGAVVVVVDVVVVLLLLLVLVVVLVLVVFLSLVCLFSGLFAGNERQEPKLYSLAIGRGHQIRGQRGEKQGEGQEWPEWAAGNVVTRTRTLSVCCRV